MRQQIESLLILQDRDQKLAALKHQRTGAPRERKNLEARLAAARTAADQAKNKLRENEVERRKLELEVEGKRTSIGRFKTQQQQTRKNDEYQALTKEIEHFEADIRSLEDRELEVMEQSESLRRAADAAEQEFLRSQASVQEQISKLEAGASAAAARQAELEADHARLASDISEEVLDLYRRLFAKKGDAAVVPLEHDVCGGCHMKVPVQTAAIVRGDQVLSQCPNCGRILYRAI